MNTDCWQRKTHSFPSHCPKYRKNDSVWSGLRTNLLTISTKGVVYFLWVSCLGIFLHSYKALGLFIHERRLCLNVSSLASSHVSLTVLFLSSPLCSLCQAIYTGVLLLSCPGLVWYDQWATLDTEANSLSLKISILPSSRWKRIKKAWNRWSRSALLQELGQTLLFLSSYSKYTSPTCLFSLIADWTLLIQQ